MKKILLVEDNEFIIKGLKYLLEKQYLLDIVMNKKDALEKVNNIYDLIILDVSLPDGNGFEVGEQFINKPILFLTAHDLEEDIVKGLSIGEDYITKPFRNAELLARIEKILKRTDSDIVYFKDLVIDKNKKLINMGNINLEVTPLEYNIILYLFTNAEKIVTRDKILSIIWDDNNKFVNDNTLSVYIKRIREKLSGKYIKTIKGIGYMVSADEEV